jgi:opacity protein-like surface antigen
MIKALMITLLSLVSVGAFAQQQDDYEIETIERNISRSNGADEYKEQYSDASNEAKGTKDSPQINIFNANSNSNKQNQKAVALSDAEADVQNEVLAEAVSENDVNNSLASRTSDIRNARKNMEIGTEQKMVEKIEWSRIEDEKDRADRLFGNRLDKKYNNGYQDDYKKEEPKVIVIEKPAYAAPVEYKAEPEYKKPEYKPAPVYEEAAAVKTEEHAKNWWGEEAYIAPMFGTINYSAENVRPDTAYGLAVGSRFDSNVSIEGSFLYSELEMDDYRVAGYNGFQVVPGLKNVTQYGFGGAVKYNFGMGRISPFVGALGTYTYREYEEMRLGTGSADSTAFDAGIALGVDVKVAKNFSIGAEYRIMKNLTNDRNEENTQQVTQQSQWLHPQTAGKSMEPLEDLNYQAFLINGKFSF